MEATCISHYDYYYRNRIDRPIFYFIVLLVAELKHLADYLESDKLSSLKQALQHPSISKIIGKITDIFDVTEAELDAAIIDYLQRFGKELMSQVTRAQAISSLSQ